MQAIARGSLSSQNVSERKKGAVKNSYKVRMVSPEGDSILNFLLDVSFFRLTPDFRDDLLSLSMPGLICSIKLSFLMQLRLLYFSYYDTFSG